MASRPSPMPHSTPHPILHRALAALAPRVAGAGDAPTPTADLYAVHALRAELAAGRLPDAPLARPAPGVLAAGEPADSFVVLRYAPPALARAILAARPRRLVVLVDDDMPALARDPGQPLAYRLRQAYAWRTVRALLAAATHVIAPSGPLLERLATHAPHAAPRRLDPALLAPLPPLDHHREGTPFTALLSDTRGHAADVAAAAPAIRRALDARPALRLVTRLGDHAPDALRHRQATHLPPLPWSEFRAARASTRAHASLVPRLPTPINAARSATRLLDAAAAGSVGLFSAVPAIEAHLAPLPGWTHGEIDWTAAILRLVDDRALTADLAARTAAIAARVGDAERQRRFWLDLLC